MPCLLAVEGFIQRTQPAYYAALAFANRKGDCGLFVTYSMERIDKDLAVLLSMPDPVRRAGPRCVPPGAST